jgi:hypothetical protein
LTDRGIIAIARKLLRHERFAPEPFTEREAWIWMLCAAAFAPHRKQVGRIEVELKRGQFAASLRFMAKEWGWTEARVRRFLSKLRGPDALIDAVSDAGVSIITICKYDVYQRALRADDAAADAAADARNKLRQAESENPSEVHSHTHGDARARKLISPEAAAFADELARICGYDPAFLPPQWVSAWPAYRVQMMLDAGWMIPVMRDAARAVMARKHDGPPATIRYFEKVFARAHAPQLPLARASRSDIDEGCHVQAAEQRLRVVSRNDQGFSAIAARLRARTSI